MKQQFLLSVKAVLHNIDEPCKCVSRVAASLHLLPSPLE